jgi:hypothetical protein
MKLSFALLAASSAADLTMLGNTDGWTQSGNSFTGAGAWRGRHVFLGKSTGGGMCASANANIDATLHLPENRYGELGSVMMRADSKTGSTGYTCKLDTRKGQGVMLTRDGKKPNNCVHRDFHLGKPTRWDPNALWRADLQNQCFIRDRAWTMFNGATDYNMKMTIVENADETATIECSVDGKLLAWYTDPCPLKGGEYGLQTSRNVAQFAINDFTDRSCDDVPVKAAQQPSLADGLTLTGMGKTSQFWKSAGQTANTVTHYYSGACNSHGGKNREAGGGVYGGSSSYGARSDALNVASLKPKKCVKDGFIEADVSLVADYLNGPSRQYGAGSNGAAGLLMRVESDSDGKDHKYGVNYDSWGYLFQVDMTHGKFSVYRGNNGGDHNRNSIAGGYLTGRYRCKNCKCKSGWEGCTQFTKPVIGSTHNLRLELSTVKGRVTGEDRTHVKAYLNGTLVADVVDEEHHRHKRYLSGGGPSDETNMCGDFGLATYDSDVVSYKIKDYTGYVKDTPVACIGEYGDYSECTKSCASGTKTRAFAVITPAAFGGAECAVKDGHSDTATCNADVPCPEPVDVEMTINETPESFTEDKKTALIAKIAKQLGLNVEDVEITVGAKANPVGDRRLMQASQLLITVTIKVLAAEVGAEVEKLESKEFRKATGCKFQQFKPSHGSVICATCKWDGHHIKVTHYINAQKNGEKGLQHKCFHKGGVCKCVCK